MILLDESTNESTKFKLIPVYDLKALVNTWPYYIDGVEETLKNENSINLEEIYNRLCSTDLLLWVGFNENKYCGFLITGTSKTPFGKLSLNIISLFIKKGVNKEIFFLGFDKIKEFAKEINCFNLKFWTRRDKGFAKKLKPLGWELGLQEFIHIL